MILELFQQRGIFFSFYEDQRKLIEREFKVKINDSTHFPFLDNSDLIAVHDVPIYTNDMGLAHIIMYLINKYRLAISIHLIQTPTI